MSMYKDGSLQLPHCHVPSLAGSTLRGRTRALSPSKAQQTSREYTRDTLGKPGALDGTARKSVTTAPRIAPACFVVA
eukprot:s534_g19.t2